MFSLPHWFTQTIWLIILSSVTKSYPRGRSYFLISGFLLVLTLVDWFSLTHFLVFGRYLLSYIYFSSLSQLVQPDSISPIILLTRPLLLNLTWPTCTIWNFLSHITIIGTGVSLILVGFPITHISHLLIYWLDMFILNYLCPCPYFLCLVLSDH